ncbi:MAG: arylsulfatase [Planctomycetia bacterium]|nr:arylsulfatase [Planctomycetia bacterium]
MKNEYRQLGAVVLTCVALWLACSTPSFAADAAPRLPNVVYVLCDDLGYGDVQALNPQRGKIATPNIDRLVSQGMSFTEAHSGSSVCTPTRYGILTGRYAWRTRLQQGVLFGLSPPLIDPSRLTVAQLLKPYGYHTACIGKWHLGMTFAGGGKKISDLAKPIQDGPITRGFDYYFGITASLDMPPFAYIENDHFTELPSVQKHIVRTGLAAPGFEAVDVLPTITKKAVEYIDARGADHRPFFLYLPLSSPHAPIVPTKAWQGKSGLNVYGDFVMQTDAALGEVLASLDKHGLADDTLVIFTSDNGCSPVANVAELEKKGHFPSESRRGYKADIFDGGHRIPFIARWPQHIKPGTKTDQLICLTDLMATCAELVGARLPENSAEDSVSLLPVLLDKADGPRRDAAVHHSINGSFAIRQGKWKLELCNDSGGWSAPLPGSRPAPGTPPAQLYDMSKDIGERANEYQQHPEVAARLTDLLQKFIADGRSTPGSPQKNDVNVKMWKHGEPNSKSPEKK